MTTRDPIEELVEALVLDREPSAAWVARWLRDGDDPVVAAWAHSDDLCAMLTLCALEGGSRDMLRVASRLVRETADVPAHEPRPGRSLAVVEAWARGEPVNFSALYQASRDALEARYAFNGAEPNSHAYGVCRAVECLAEVAYELEWAASNSLDHSEELRLRQGVADLARESLGWIGPWASEAPRILDPALALEVIRRELAPRAACPVNTAECCGRWTCSLVWYLRGG